MKRPARARERMRLAAALGILAAVAIAAGGLASLATATPMLPNRRGAQRSAPNLGWAAPIEASTRDEPRRAVEHAEAAAEQARAVLERARARGELDEATLSAYEARLQQIGSGTPRSGSEPAAIRSRPRAQVSPRQSLRAAKADDRGL